jgi:DNA-binding winged helix-turn-helix (wHTH) protein
MVKAFGDFEFDDRRKTLTAADRAIRLSGQTVELLSLLLERPGELIMREEIRRRLWPESHVEFEHSLDVVVSRLRSVLGDDSPHRRYIETVPRKGYRFSEPVSMKGKATRSERFSWARRLGKYAAVAILVAIVAILIVRSRYEKFVPRRHSQTLTAPGYKVGERLLPGEGPILLR